jgi:hypothetical protein
MSSARRPVFAQTPNRGMAEAIDPLANGERLARPTDDAGQCCRRSRPADHGWLSGSWGTSLRPQPSARAEIVSEAVRACNCPDARGVIPHGGAPCAFPSTRGAVIMLSWRARADEA